MGILFFCHHSDPLYLFLCYAVASGQQPGMDAVSARLDAALQSVAARHTRQLRRARRPRLYWQGLEDAGLAAGVPAQLRPAFSGHSPVAGEQRAVLDPPQRHLSSHGL